MGPLSQIRLCVYFSVLVAFQLIDIVLALFSVHRGAAGRLVVVATVYAPVHGGNDQSGSEVGPFIVELKNSVISNHITT